MHQPRSTVVTIALVCLCAASAAAQTRPDFSGRWVEDASQRKSPYDTASSAGARAMSSAGVETVITQADDQLIIERDFIELTRHVHHLDGREDRNRNGAQVHTTRTTWQGDRLVTEGLTYQVTSHGETSWKVKEVRWLTAKGELVLETTRVDEDGQANTVVQVFQKKR
jgi:hypothetical protein